jgi:hypothetical protein
MKFQALISKQRRVGRRSAIWDLGTNASLVIRISSFVILSVAALQAFSEENSASALPEVKSIRLGFGNHYKLGCWTPVQVELSGAGGESGMSGRLDVQAPDGDDVPAWFIGPKIKETDGRAQTAYVRIGRADSPLRVRLTTSEGEGDHSPELLPGVSSAADAQALPATNELIVQLGASIGLPEMFHRLELPELERADVVTIDQKQPLPDRWFGYEGVDLVVIAGVPTVDKSLIDAAAIEALDHWIHLGGTLLVTCGEGADRVFAADSPLHRFAPGEFAGMTTLSAIQLGAIESFARGEERLEATSLRVPQWKNVPASQVELSSSSRAADSALVVRSPRGFGQVIYVGLDFDKPPLSKWLGRNKFLERLLGRHSPGGGQSTAQEGPTQGTHLGFVDLSGQLRGALDQFDGVQLIPFWLVATLALVYIAALSGLTYWVAVRWLGRPGLAWVMLPAIVVLFCAVAFAVAHQAKGSRRQINQVDLVDIDMAQGRVRGTTWFNIFSPENALFDLRVKPTFAGQRANTESTSESASSLLAWLGLPGTGLGGMNSRAVNLPLFDEPYEIDPQQGAIAGAPLSAWSSKSFVARWESTGGGIESKLTMSEDGRLHGSIVSQLDVPLKDCVLLFGRTERGERGWAYPLLKPLSPGDNIPFEHLESQTVETFLTKRRIISSKDEAAGYDRAAFDVSRIVEVMMFHDRAGATNYTGLLNRYQNFVDMSNELELGRAILVGHGPEGATVEINLEATAAEGENNHTTIYRFVLPVTARQN